MTVKPQSHVEQQHPTEEDGDAQFASVIWFREQRGAGKLEQYQKKFVAILGERIIDADANESELHRRLDALGNAIPQFRATVQYVGDPAEDY